MPEVAQNPPTATAFLAGVAGCDNFEVGINTDGEPSLPRVTVVCILNSRDAGLEMSALNAGRRR
jgi:hypothetical protein